jgi:hypothetical protein
MRTKPDSSRLQSLLERGPSLTADFSANHHLWQRAGVWQTTLTLFTKDGSKRISRSLRTRDVGDPAGGK